MKSSSAHNISKNLDQYRAIFEEIEDIILIMNPQGTIEYVNRALRKHLGSPKIWYTGKNVGDCLNTDPELDRDSFIQLLFNKSDFMNQVKNAKGEKLHFSWKIKPFYQEDKKKLLAIIRDITPEIRLQKKAEEYSKNLQEMVFQRTRQLEREKQKALDLHQAKALFLSKMSHELRTPLTSISGYVELLNESGLNAQERKKYLMVIEKNAKKLLEMINETLDMVKLEQGKHPIKERSFKLKNLLSDLEDTFAVLAEENQLTLRIVCSQQVPEKLYSDPQVIQQILTNLLSNAIKFTNKGSVIMKVKQRTFPHKHSQKLYFYIQDTGIGIPPEYHHRVFRSFEQYLDNHIVNRKGTGLGLAISRQMARLLNGNVKLVSSQPNKGSTFVFSLPIRSPKAS